MSTQTDIPEGYELAEHSTAKDIARNALEEELQRQGFADVEEGGPDLLDLANVSVEALLAAGVTIPEGLAEALPTGETATKRREPVEHGAAKNLVMDALEQELERQDFVEGEGGPELIELADTTVEVLLASGITIPEGLADPHDRQPVYFAPIFELNDAAALQVAGSVGSGKSASVG